MTTTGTVHPEHPPKPERALRISSPDCGKVLCRQCAFCQKPDPLVIGHIEGIVVPIMM
jgi:hypothetical protein